MHQTYRTVFGGPAVSPIIVSLSLPHLGEYGFKWIIAEAIGKEYGHYAFRIHPKATPVNVHVYGDRNVIEHLARTGNVAVCEIEIVEKTISSEKKFVFLNLKLVHPRNRATHELGIGAKSKSEHQFFFSTDGMHGVGIGISRI